MTDIGYTGHRLDASDSLVFAKNRYFDPATGRWLTPDILVENPYEPQSLNRYAYCRNNPITYVDPLGLWRISISFHAGIGGHLSYDSRSGHLRGGVGVGIGASFSYGQANWGVGASNAAYLDVGYDNKMKSVYITGQYGQGVQGGNGQASHGWGASGTYYFRQDEYQVGAGAGWFGMNANAGYSSFGDGSWSYGGGWAQFNATYNEGSKSWSYFYTLDTKDWKGKYRNEQKRSEQNGGNGYGPIMENPLARGFFKGMDWIATVTTGRNAADVHDSQYGNPSVTKGKADFGLMTNMATGSISAMPYPNGFFNTAVGLALSPVYYMAVGLGGEPARRAALGDR
ncbi:MAG: RHS repeat-associated core domain-containing protein [Elusimicrobia bacterium]|nr:RHS repeat-associated core domain-containing protein [Elusimicrobiota bacterium]